MGSMPVGHAITLKTLFSKFDKVSKLKSIKIFKVFMRLLIEDIIENRVAFKTPSKLRTEIGMYIDEGDELAAAMRNGAYKGLDFITSDFKGGKIKIMFYNDDGYVFYTYNVHVKKKYRDRIVELLNEGKSLAPSKVKEISDYYEDVQYYFPHYPLKEIRQVLNFGVRAIIKHKKYGLDIFISSYSQDYWVLIGNRMKDSLKFRIYYTKKLALKYRFLSKDKEWDGYYYFVLKPKEYELIMQQQNPRGRRKRNFTLDFPVTLYKLETEAKLKNPNGTHVFRIELAFDEGWTKFYEAGKHLKGMDLIEIKKPYTLKDVLVSNNHYFK